MCYKITIACIFYAEVIKLKKKLDDRRCQSKRFIQRPRQVSTPSILQPPADFVTWAVSRRFHLATSSQLMSGSAATEGPAEEMARSPMSANTPQSSFLTGNHFTSTPHSISSTTTPHSSSLTSTPRSSLSTSNPTGSPISRRMRASQVCLTDASESD